MKNIAKAVSLVLICLLGILPTIQAQNTDTKAAPDLPNFKVTLGVTNTGNGAVKMTNDKDKQTLNASGTLQLVYGAKPAFTLTANPQYMLESFTVNGQAETLNATFTTGTPKVNTYTWTLNSGLTAKTDIAITWKEKPSVKVTVTGTEQIVNASSGATAVTVTPNGLTLAYYKEKECTTSINVNGIKTAGTYYVKITKDETATEKAIDMIVPLVISNKKVLEIVTSKAPTCETQLLQGQPLSAAVITATAGDVKVKDVTPEQIIKGTWSWANPNQAVTAGAAASNTYDAIFTPDLSSLYTSVTKSIGVAALTVTTVTVQQTDGGVVAITGATADNKYIGTTTAVKADLEATATPKAGYKFVKWVNPSETTNAGSETVVTKANITISDNMVISAEFAKATRTVTIGNHDYGTLKVMNGASEVATKTAVPVGTTLTIVATPKEGYQVEKVGYTAADADAAGRAAQPATVATSFVVGGTKYYSYAVSATFSAIPASEFMVNVAEMQNGTLLIKNAEGTVVSPNGAVATGTVLSVVANPNRGYKLGTFLVNAKPANENASIIVTAETTIAATFVKESYPITTSDQQVTYSVAPCSKEFGTIIPKVTATVRDAKNYKLISLLVNGQPVANGSDVQVDGPTNLSAQVTKLTPITLLNEPSTEVTYNGKPQEYAVLTAEGLAGFKVTYDGDENVPTAANTYTVAITRPADDVYADFSATRSFVINKGVPGILVIPFSDKVTGTEVSGSSTVAGKWQTEKPGGTRSAAFALRAATQVIYFVPDDKNLGYVTATAVSSDATAVTVTMPTTTGGTLVLKNGTVAVTNGNTYTGQTFTIEAIPDAGYTVDQHKILVNGVAKTTFTLENATVTVTAADVFKAKGVSTPTESTSNAFAALTYTGAPLKLDVSGAGLVGDAGKWVLTYQTSTGTPTTLTQVGTGYKVFASYLGDGQYAACAATQIGTVNIEKVVLIPNHVTLPTASAIMTGTTLSTSQLSSGEVKVNGSSIPGMFAWTSAATVINKAGNQAVTFTPTDLANYTALNDLKVYVSLRDVKKHTMTLVKVNTGTAVITDASGAEVKNGELVSEGMQLTVKAAVGSKAIDKVVVTPNVAITTDGLTTTFVTPTTDFTVTVTFKTDGEVTPPTPVVKYAVYVTSAGKGTLKVMNGKKEVMNGDEVTANTELTITATATKGNKLTSLLYNGSTIASGAKKMVTEATTISAVFTADPDPTPTVIAVKGISVDAATKALVVKTGFTLKAAINPTNADNQKVTWTNSNPMVASATGTGLELKVTALKAGTTTFTVTTDEGKFTATCVVTVTAATGLEEFGTTRVYPLGGAICVDPAMPLEVSVVSMAGAMVYRDQLTTVYQIPVASGVYLVHLSDGKNQGTMKVIVK